jgi:hypothetical protein
MLKKRRATIINNLFPGKRFITLAVISISVFLAQNLAFSQTAVTPAGDGTSTSPYLIAELGNLVWMSDNAATSSGKYYTMTADIDASSTSTWNSGAGFVPIGTYSSPDTTSFRGTFDGGGHTITGLVINRPSTWYVGLFGRIGLGGMIKNIGLVGGSVTGGYSVGSLIGYNKGTVSNIYASGKVMGMGTEKPLLGVGGLIGYNQGTVSNAYASGIVTGTSDYGIGGLVGRNYSGTVSNAYANSIVTGNCRVGGLVGENEGSVSNIYATGTVTGDGCVGGLIGFFFGSTGPILSNVYATGTVTGHTNVGGLIGGMIYGRVSNAYATGKVTVTGSSVGGLIGHRESGTVSSSYWDTETSGTTTGVGYGDSTGVTGKMTAEMKHQATFTNWDFATVWIINETQTYPLLRSLLASGDANVDGLVDVGDLGILAANYGGSGKNWFLGDFNGDGAVDVGDLGILAANYGSGSASAADISADDAEVSDASADDADSETLTATSSDDTSTCTSLGLSLIAVLAFMGLMLSKFEEE